MKSISPSELFFCKSKEEALKKTASLQLKLYDLLYLMFAQGEHSLLIILQGIDTSGKDGTVRHLFSAANPQGIQVFSFKKPTPEELKHDFLWRCHQHTPESGLTSIFNRSYYEEVTTVKVHKELLKKQSIPSFLYKKKDFFINRYKRINEFEKLLTQKGTQVIKIFLHISKAEQLKRIKERMNDRSKNWKFSKQDVLERKYWNQYQTVFNQMIKATSTKNARWFVIPSDKKWYRDLLISQILVDHLEKLKMTFPKMNND